MVEEKRSFHKHRKWLCPACGKVRMQDLRPKKAIPAKGRPSREE